MTFVYFSSLVNATPSKSRRPKNGWRPFLERSSPLENNLKMSSATVPSSARWWTSSFPELFPKLTLPAVSSRWWKILTSKCCDQNFTKFTLFVKEFTKFYNPKNYFIPNLKYLPVFFKFSNTITRKKKVFI